MEEGVITVIIREDLIITIKRDKIAYMNS